MRLQLEDLEAEGRLIDEQYERWSVIRRTWTGATFPIDSRLQALAQQKNALRTLARRIALAPLYIPPEGDKVADVAARAAWAARALAEYSGPL